MRDEAVFTDPSGARKTFRRSRYSVAVKTHQGGRWRNVHTFASHSPGEWFRLLPRSARQSRREDLRSGPTTEALGDGTVPLADGLDPKASDLVVILDALRSDERHEVDIADITRVVSKLGSFIAQLGSLTAEQRRLAEPALYAEILRRCTTIDSSM
jgi:hypothetical protein